MRNLDVKIMDYADLSARVIANYRTDALTIHHRKGPTIQTTLAEYDDYEGDMRAFVADRIAGQGGGRR